VGFVVGTAVLKSFKFVIKILQVKKKKIRLFSTNFTNLIKKKKKKKTTSTKLRNVYNAIILRFGLSQSLHIHSREQGLSLCKPTMFTEPHNNIQTIL
jgi:hypothetical protein